MNHHELSAHGATDRGRQRETNEDSLFCDPARGLFIVIDGVGGYAAGEVAASIAVDLISRRLLHKTGTAEERLREAITAANNEIFNQSLAHPKQRGMACVLTAAVVEQDAVVVGHVGDTRLYEVHGKSIRKRTRDHSLVGLREDAGELSEEAARNHPLRSEILRDVGSLWHEPDDEDFVDIYRFPFAPESALLLCSDGLTDMISSEAIHRTLLTHAGHPEASVRALIAQANAAGGQDNITAVVVEGPAFAQAVSGKGFVERPAGDAVEDLPAPAGQAPARRFGMGLLAGLLLALLPVLLVSWRLERKVRDALHPAAYIPQTRYVSPEGDAAYRSIGLALVAAGPGDVVSVAPGIYREALRLRDSVHVVSRVPGGAVLRVGAGPDTVAVLADGVQGAELRGFKIEPDTGAAHYAIGVYLRNAAVDVAGLEVTGAGRAAVLIDGAATARLEANALVNNPGVGVHVRGAGAQPLLVQNVLLRNGAGQAAPGVLIEEGAAPVLVRNLIAGSAAEGIRIRGLPSGLAETLRGQNFFSVDGLGNARGPVQVAWP